MDLLHRLFGVRPPPPSAEQLADVCEDLHQQLARNDRKMAGLRQRIAHELDHGHEKVCTMLATRLLVYRTQREQVYSVLLAVEKAQEALEMNQLNGSTVRAMHYIASELTKTAEKVKPVDVRTMQAELDKSMREAQEVTRLLGAMNEGGLGGRQSFSKAEIRAELDALRPEEDSSSVETEEVIVPTHDAPRAPSGAPSPLLLL